MRWLSCSMAVGCNWMQDCLKPVSLWPDTTFPLQAREFDWVSVSVNGSTNSSSQHCPSIGSWSRRCLISTMGGEPLRPCSLTEIWKKIPTAGAPTRSVQELWQVACQWVWNLRLSLGKTMQGGKTREIEWAPVKATPPFLVPEESPPQEYGPWQRAAA